MKYDHDQTYKTITQRGTSYCGEKKNLTQNKKNRTRVIASIEFLSSDDQKEKPQAAKPPWPKECRRAQRKHRILTPALGSNNVCIYESLGTYNLKHKHRILTPEHFFPSCHETEISGQRQKRGMCTPH